MARPSPVPPRPTGRVAPRWKRSNATAASSAEIPGPSSSTAMKASSPSAPQVIVTVPPDGECSSAFSIRLSRLVARSSLLPTPIAFPSGAHADVASFLLGAAAPARPRFASSGCEIDRLARWRRRIGRGQPQQIRDEAGESHGLGVRGSQLLARRPDRRCHVGRLDAQTQPGQRRAQLVRGIATKARWASSESREPIGHRVEAPGDLSLLRRPLDTARASRSPPPTRCAVTARRRNGRVREPATNHATTSPNASARSPTPISAYWSRRISLSIASTLWVTRTAPTGPAREITGTAV